MKIIRPAAPSNVRAAIGSTLRDLPPPPGQAGATDRVGDPLPLYGVNSAALVDGDRDDIFIHYGWRALVETGGTVRFADVEADGEGLCVTRVIAGGAVRGLLEAGTQAPRQADSDEAYELRIIEGPSVKTAALWLAGNPHRFICYSESGIRTFDEAGFIEHLRSRAEDLRAAYVRGLHHWAARRPQSAASPDRHSDDDPTGGNEL